MAGWDHEPVMNFSAANPAASKRSATRSSAASMHEVPMEAPAGNVVLLYTGWLTKEGHFIKNWKQRFFRLVLDGSAGYKTSFLAYFAAADTSPDPMRAGHKGVILLDGASVAPGDDEITFTLTDAKKKNLVMRAPSPADRKKWLGHIDECISLCDPKNRTTAQANAAEAAAEDGKAPSWLSDLGGCE
jgi:hypothetical protein